MSSGAVGVDEEHEVHVHTPPTSFIWKYVFSTDHKVIGIQYYTLGLISMFVGVTLSLLFRWHLSHPAGEGVKPFLEGNQYLQYLTMHGTILVFMVLTTAPLGGFGNYVLPIQIGAVDMAFPRLNMLSFWITFASWVTLMAAFFVPGGAPSAGWTGYPPLSAVPEAVPEGATGMNWGQSLWVLSIALFCIASLVGAINFIVTTLDLRARGMTLMRMPLSVWAWFLTAIIALLSFAVLMIGGLLLLLDRHLGTSFFLPNDVWMAGIQGVGKEWSHKGGSPILYQHLFWFFGHPEVYIAILPSMGIVSHIIANFARKPIFGYKAMVYAMAAIGFLGFIVWGHHMFQSGMSPYLAIAFSVLTMTIGVPSAIKTFNWLGTIWKGDLKFTAAMLFSLGFVSLFVSGGISGIFLGQSAPDIYFHDTYFVVAHFHLIMGVASLFGIVAGTYYWFPKMMGRCMNETLGKLHFWGTFIGVYMIFMPMHFIGLSGHPRRYSGFEFDFLNTPEMHISHTLITHAAIFTAAMQIIFVGNMLWSLVAGKKATENPWEGTSLEWTMASPPPWDNFGGKEPVVHHGAYEYSVPGAAKDYVMQTDPPEAVPANAHQPH